MIRLNRICLSGSKESWKCALVIPKMRLLFLVLVTLSAFTLLYRPLAINIPGEKIG